MPGGKAAATAEAAVDNKPARCPPPNVPRPSAAANRARTARTGHPVGGEGVVDGGKGRARVAARTAEELWRTTSAELIAAIAA